MSRHQRRHTLHEILPLSTFSAVIRFAAFFFSYAPPRFFFFRDKEARGDKISSSAAIDACRLFAERCHAFADAARLLFVFFAAGAVVRLSFFDA